MSDSTAVDGPLKAVPSRPPPKPDFSTAKTLEEMKLEAHWSLEHFHLDGGVCPACSAAKHAIDLITRVEEVVKEMRETVIPIAYQDEPPPEEAIVKRWADRLEGREQ